MEGLVNVICREAPDQPQPVESLESSDCIRTAEGGFENDASLNVLDDRTLPWNSELGTERPSVICDG